MAKEPKVLDETTAGDGDKGGTVHERLARARRALGAVGKGGRNQFDKYDYRSIDDLYNAVGPLFAAEGLVVGHELRDAKVEEFDTQKGGKNRLYTVRVAYWFTGADGSETKPDLVLGEGADRGDKAANKAMTAAYKVWLTQKFCIPTKDTSIDSEQDSPDLVGDAPARGANGNGHDAKGRPDVVKAKPNAKGPPTAAQSGKIAALMKAHGLSADYMKAVCGELFQRDRPATAEEASVLIDRIEQDAAAAPPEGA